MVQDPHESGGVARLVGDGDGFVGEGAAAFERTAEGELLAQVGKQWRPVEVVVREACERGLQGLDLVGIDETDCAEKTPVVGQGGGNQALVVTEVGSPASGLEECVAVGGVPRLALGGPEADAQVEPKDRIRIEDLRVEVEGLGVIAKSVVGGQGLERGVGCLAGVVEGLWPGPWAGWH